MKRFLLVFSVIITLVSILLFLSPHLLKISGLDVPVKNYLFPRIIDTTQVELDLDNFSIGLGTLEFRDVSLESERNNYKLFIESLSFDFDFYKLVFNIRQPQLALRRIVLNTPRVILYDQKKPLEPVKSVNAVKATAFLSFLNRIPQIHSIHVKNGKIIFRNWNGQFISLAQNLQGELREISKHGFELSLGGCLLSNEDDNFQIKSRVDTKHQAMSGDVRFFKYQLSKSVLPYFTQEVIINKGELNGAIRFSYGSADSLGNKIKGKISVRDLAGTIRDYSFSGMRFNIDLNNEKLIVSDGLTDFLGSVFKFSAHIDDLESPKIIADYETNNFPIVALKNSFSADEGVVNKAVIPLYGKLTAEPANNFYQLQLNSRELKWEQNRIINNLSAAIVFQKDDIFLKKISFGFADFMVKGSGSYQPHKNSLGISLHGKKAAEVRGLLDRVSGKEQSFKVELSLNTSSHKTEGSWQYNLAGAQDTLFAFSGKMTGDKKSFAVPLFFPLPE